MNHPAKKRGADLWLYFTGIIFATVAAIFVLICAVLLLLFAAGRINIDPRDRHTPILIFLAGSVLLGAILTVFVGKLIIRPIQTIGEAFDALSRGDFSVRVSEKQRIGEICEMARKFNAMAHDLSHMETLRSDFVANVSHEFKTPLSSIEGYATLLQNQTLSRQKQEHYVHKILDNSRKLSDLSSNILLLSKLENQQIVAGNTEFRLDEQIRRTILMLEDKWTARDVTFDMELPLQMYCGHEALLERVWSNIIDNAIRYSPPGSSIRIGIERDERLCVCIADHGCGMSEEVQKHIFEKFYQGDPSRRDEGNGLGLALVRRIVDLCGGEIDVQSSPGQGTVFRVFLP